MALLGILCSTHQSFLQQIIEEFCFQNFLTLTFNMPNLLWNLFSEMQRRVVLVITEKTNTLHSLPLWFLNFWSHSLLMILER